MNQAFWALSRQAFVATLLAPTPDPASRWQEVAVRQVLATLLNRATLISSIDSYQSNTSFHSLNRFALTAASMKTIPLFIVVMIRERLSRILIRCECNGCKFTSTSNASQPAWNTVACIDLTGQRSFTHRLLTEKVLKNLEQRLRHTEGTANWVLISAALEAEIVYQSWLSEVR